MIKIAGKLAPFSHLPGARCLIPGTTWEVEAFPALLRFKNLAGEGSFELPLSHKGPVKNFTVELDLHKARVCIYGHAVDGYFHSLLMREGDRVTFDGTVLPLTLGPAPHPNDERLSLGFHKQQDWDLMLRRMDPCELWPFLLRLSHLIPQMPVREEGSYVLLSACDGADKVKQVELWKKVFMGCFVGILSPRLSDEKHQGLFPEKNSSSVSLGLIHEAARLARSLFFSENAGEVYLLPHLPPECHAGRFLGLKTQKGDRIDLEWSKKSIKKVVIEPAHTGQLHLKLQKGISHFRVRRSERERGERIICGEKLSLVVGERLLLDRFE